MIKTSIKTLMYLALKIASINHNGVLHYLESQRYISISTYIVEYKHTKMEYTRNKMTIIFHKFHTSLIHITGVMAQW